MMKYKYTNKNEKPVPRYKPGQKVWTRWNVGNGYEVRYTIIRKVCDVRWIDYSDNPYSNGTSHWEVGYRHQPYLYERMKQYPINEEELFETEAEAVQAMFSEFAKDTIRLLGNFRNEYKRLGIAYNTMTKLLENIKKDEKTETDIEVDKT